MAEDAAGAAPPSASQHLHYLTYKSLARAITAIPSPLVPAIGTAAGLTMSEVWRGRRPVVRANLRRVVGPAVSETQLDRLVVQAFDYYAQYWLESARLASLTPAQVLKRFRCDGFERVAEEMAKHRGVILALPHLGLWELGGVWLTLKGCPMTTVVEPLEPPELFEWFKGQREDLGLTIHTLGRDAAGKLVAALRAGRLVGLVADRDLVGDGVEVEFFGEKTSLPGGAALLALRTGAPLFPCAVYQEPHGRGHGVIRPPLEIERTSSLRHDVRRVTQELARHFEELIGAEPAQWHMFQPNWPADKEKFG
ncbi:MAG TPA: phosphatidylinositol mannoside acyltransferase [Acidimicrobiales bacterium]|nr:phosphatidylinositol mannoside acyltransferase [Acidimicrobiales bacterium]